MPWCAPRTRSRSSTSRRSRCGTGSPPGSCTRPSASMPPCRTTSPRQTSPRCASSPCSGSPTRSTAPCAPTVRAGDRRELAGQGTGRRRPHRRPRRRDPAASRCTDRRPLGRRRTARGAHLGPGRAAQRDPGGARHAAHPRRIARRQLHQVVGDDIPATLVEFAQGVDATQLVIGVSRRSRLAAALTGPGIGSEVIRRSGDIDVHIVTHAAAGGRLALPRMTGGALGWRRQLLGFAVALVFGPLLSWLMFTFRSPESITAEVLAYQLLVVVVALIGGVVLPCSRPCSPASHSTSSSFAPLFTITIAHPLHVLALALYVLIAILVSIIVDQAARRARTAQRATAEAELLAAVAGNVLRGDNAVLALASRTREAFGLSACGCSPPTARCSPATGSRSPTDEPRASRSAVRPGGGPRADAGAERRTAGGAGASAARRDRGAAVGRDRAHRPAGDRERGRGPWPRPTRCAARCCRREP